jgi:hypothetical protein
VAIPEAERFSSNERFRFQLWRQDAMVMHFSLSSREMVNPGVFFQQFQLILLEVTAIWLGIRYASQGTRLMVPGEQLSNT